MRGGSGVSHSGVNIKRPMRALEADVSRDVSKILNPEVENT